ncbi:MAG: hypothetical protein ACI4C5_09950 [Lachnospiraceae bacterium]
MEDIYKSKGDRAIEFVEEKYGIEFEPETYEKADYLSSTDRVHCYAEGMNREEEHVEVTITRENGKTVYGDNYFGFWIRPQIEEYIGKIIEEEFSEFKVYKEDDYENFPNDLTCDSTLEDLFAHDGSYIMSIKVYIKADGSMSEEEYAERMERIKDRLLESNQSYIIYIFAVGEEMYDSISRYEQDEFWHFYVTNQEPDGKNYYYLYNSMIVDGEVI